MPTYTIATWSEVPARESVWALVSNVDLVIIRFDDNPSVMSAGACTVARIWPTGTSTATT